MKPTALDGMFALFATLFGEPNTADKVAYLNTYRHMLGFASDSLLKRAVELFLRDNEIHAWPQPGTILKFYKRAAAEVERRAELEGYKPQIEAPRRTAEQRARVHAEWSRFHAAMTAKAAVVDLQRVALPAVDRRAWEARRAGMVADGRALATPTFAAGRPVNRGAYAGDIERWVA